MRALALFLTIALAPGFAEAVEDFVHWVAEGHTLHAPAVEQAAHASHAEHEREHGDGEHGCSTLFHICGCHSPTPSMITLRLSVTRSGDIEHVLTRAPADTQRRPLDGVSRETFRPPIA